MARVGKFSPDSRRDPQPFQTQTNMPKPLCSDTLYTLIIRNILLYPLYETLRAGSKFRTEYPDAPPVAFCYAVVFVWLFGALQAACEWKVLMEDFLVMEHVALPAYCELHGQRQNVSQLPDLHPQYAPCAICHQSV